MNAFGRNGFPRIGTYFCIYTGTRNPESKTPPSLSTGRRQFNIEEVRGQLVFSRLSAPTPFMSQSIWSAKMRRFSRINFSNRFGA